MKRRINWRRVNQIQELVQAEKYEEAMNLCARYRISPVEWRFILNNERKDPEIITLIIKKKRKEHENK